MGIFHSTTTRFTASKLPDEEEGEGPANYPHLQNQNQILPSFSLIYKATKGLLQKVCLVFNFLRPRKTADDPLLPIRNPPPTALRQPLLLPTIEPQTDDLENAFEPQTDDLDGIDHQSENDCHVSCSQEWKGDSYSADRNEIDRGSVVSIPEIRCSNALISARYDEIIEEIAPANSPCVEESVRVKELEEDIEEVEVKKKMKQNKEKEEVGLKKKKKKKKKQKKEEEEGEEVRVNKYKKKKKKNKEEEVEVKEEEVNVAVHEKERRLKHYSSRHKILLVGEGDFSFSACLARAFATAPNIIATSLNLKEFLKKNYGKAMSNIAELRSRGSKVMHGIDATEMANHKLLRQVKFDRIIFNFPFAGFFRNLSTEDQLRHHGKLVSLFLKNAKEMISENGEIHISHKTNGNFYANFNLESIASSHGLRLIQAVKFKLFHYPGYDTKFGFGGDGNFNCYPSKTFKFGLKSTAPVL